MREELSETELFGNQRSTYIDAETIPGFGETRLLKNTCYGVVRVSALYSKINTSWVD